MISKLAQFSKEGSEQKQCAVIFSANFSETLFILR